MQFRVKVDFFTDIITNSSSVVYSQARGVETMHSFLNDILKEFGLERKSEDVFNITIIPDIDRIVDWVVDGNLYGEDEFNKKLEDMNYKDAYTLSENKVNELLISGFDFSEIYEDSYEESNYSITTKDGRDTNLGNQVAGLFYHEATCNG